MADKTELNKVRPGVVRACIKVLSTVTHWRQGDILRAESVRSLALLLRDRKGRLWEDPGRTSRPTRPEALAAARAFARSLEESTFGVACQSYKNSGGHQGDERFGDLDDLLDSANWRKTRPVVDGSGLVGSSQRVD